MNLAAVLLAAGLSTRFGSSKVEALVDGRPLALHAADTLASLTLHARIVVTNAARSSARLAWPGFTTIENPAPEAGLSGSIGLGVAAARTTGADAVLIALADMPFVTASHFERLIARCHGPGGMVASRGGGPAMPPAVFGAAWWPALESLQGDAGARTLLARAELIEAPAAMLLDIDRPSDIPTAR